MNDTDKKWLAIVALVLAAFLLLNVISAVWMPFLPWMEEREAGEETIKQTMDAENAIENYEWFRTQYREIEAQRAQIENSYDELDRFYSTYGEDPDGWDRTTKEQHNRIQQRITGNQNQLENLVADYNARSDMANREVFKCQLPYQVDERFGISGPPGSGDAEQPIDTGPDGEPIDGEPVPAEQCDGLPNEVSS